MQILKLTRPQIEIETKGVYWQLSHWSII